MNLLFTEKAEVYLEEKSNKSNEKLNLVLHVKDLYKNCYTKIEPDITFETDENYLEGIDKISEWRNRINIYLDPAIEPLIKDKSEISIDLKGKIFKRLIVEDANSRIQYGCRVVFGKDVITNNLNLK